MFPSTQIIAVSKIQTGFPTSIGGLPAAANICREMSSESSELSSMCREIPNASSEFFFNSCPNCNAVPCSP